MSCNTNIVPIGLDCLENMGGIDTTYVMPYRNLDKTLYTNGFDINTTGHTITNIGLIDSGSTAIFQEIQVNENSSVWQETRQMDLANGSAGQEVTTTITFSKSDGDTRYNVNNMIKQRSLVIIKNNDGRYFLLGFRKGGFWNSGDYSSGTSITDRNGFAITFTSYELELVYEVSSSLISTIVNEA